MDRKFIRVGQVVVELNEVWQARKTDAGCRIFFNNGKEIQVDCGANDTEQLFKELLGPVCG